MHVYFFCSLYHSSEVIVSDVLHLVNEMRIWEKYVFVNEIWIWPGIWNKSEIWIKLNKSECDGLVALYNKIFGDKNENWEVMNYNINVLLVPFPLPMLGNIPIFVEEIGGGAGRWSLQPPAGSPLGAEGVQPAGTWPWVEEVRFGVFRCGVGVLDCKWRKELGLRCQAFIVPWFLFWLWQPQCCALLANKVRLRTETEHTDFQIDCLKPKWDWSKKGLTDVL
jgi:hypothetical protein